MEFEEIEILEIAEIEDIQLIYCRRHHNIYERVDYFRRWDENIFYRRCRLLKLVLLNILTSMENDI